MKKFTVSAKEYNSNNIYKVTVYAYGIIDAHSTAFHLLDNMIAKDCGKDRRFDIFSITLFTD